MVERECTLERDAGAPDVLNSYVSVPPPLPQQQQAVVSALPEVEYWKLDGRRLGFGEWIRVAGVIGGTIGCTTKLLGINILGASRIPKIENAAEFEVSEDQLREEVRTKLQPLVEEFRALGFHTPLYMQFTDRLNRSDLVAVTLFHPDAHTLGRITLMFPHLGSQAKEELAKFLISAFDGERFLVTSGDPKKLRHTPQAVVIRRQGATLEQLLVIHTKERDRLAASSLPLPVAVPEDAWAIVDAFERTSFEFSQEQKVNVPLSDAEKAADQKFLQTRAELETGGSKYAEAIAELQRLQSKASGGTWSALLLMLVTLGAFAGIGAWQWSWKTSAMILGVLFFHELGHYVAMRIFGYRELRMFFVPLLGAAVTGRKHNVPGWKKAIVSLMGPVPGIIVGALLGGLAIAWNNDDLALVSVTMVSLNAVNLLPILPLDGGWFWNTILFCRNRWLEALFKVLAGLTGIAASFLDLGKLWLYLGIVTLIGVPMTLLVGKAAATVRNNGWAPDSTDDDTVSVHAAERIFAELDAASNGKLTGKALANTGLSVFEKLNAQPPRWLASIGLVTVYAGSLFISIVSGLLTGFYLLGAGVLEDGEAMSEKPRQEQPAQVDYTLAPGDQQQFPAVQGSDKTPMRQILATFPDKDSATAAFAKIRAEQLPVEDFLRFGQAVLVYVAQEDEARAASLAENLRQAGATIFDEGESRSWMLVDLKVTAPSPEIAWELRDELRVWAGIPASVRPALPWQITAPEKRAAYREACSTYEIGEKLRKAAAKAPEVERLKRQSNFRTLLSLPGWSELDAEYRRVLHEAELGAVKKMLPLKTSEPARSVVALLLRQPVPGEENWVDLSLAWEGEMRSVLSQGEPVSEDPDVLSIEGVHNKDRTLEIRGLSSLQLSRHLPAIVRYLTEQGCSEIQYGFRDTETLERAWENDSESDPD